MYRLVGWKIFYDDSYGGTFTFRHKCGWECYIYPFVKPDGGSEMAQVRDHVC